MVCAGIALAASLWDGWPYVFFWADNTYTWRSTAPLTLEPAPTDWGDYFDAGCVTGDNLRDMAEGRSTRISCPPREVGTP